MEFQFGTNWAEYSKFVGDIFGAPLAAEGVFAFFLESGFLGLYLFGRNRVSKGVHWFSILMVAVGATLSAFWIIVANSWQQTPAGYVLRNGRAELTDFCGGRLQSLDALVRYFHTVSACLVAGASHGGHRGLADPAQQADQVARKTLPLALVVGPRLRGDVALPRPRTRPAGRPHAAREVRRHRGPVPRRAGAPLVLFAIPSTKIPAVWFQIENPADAQLAGLRRPERPDPGHQRFPPERGCRRRLGSTFVSFHNMVVLGMALHRPDAVGRACSGAARCWRQAGGILKLLVWSIPLPLIACQLGWIAAEVGRQPWIVYRLLARPTRLLQTVAAARSSSRSSCSA